MSEERYTPEANDVSKLWRLNYQEYARQSGGKGGSAQKGYSLWWALASQDPAGLAERDPLVGALFGDEACWERAKAEAAETAGARRSDRGKYLGGEPNRAQWAAIDAALSNPITFIQGPPGTGKTATIVNLLYQLYLTGQKEGRPLQVAVVSSNGSALQNIHDKLKELKDAKRDEGLADRVSRLGGKRVREDFQDTLHDGDEEKLTFSSQKIFYTQLPDQKEPVCSTRSPLEDGETQDKWAERTGGIIQSVQREQTLTVEDFFASGFAAFTSTAHSLPNCFRDGVFHQYDYVIVDEASQMSFLTGLVAMGHARRLILVGDEQQLAPVINTDTIDQLTDWKQWIEDQFGEFDELSPEEAEILQAEEEANQAYWRAHPELWEEDGLTPEERAACVEEDEYFLKALFDGWSALHTYEIQADRSFLDLCLDVFLGWERRDGTGWTGGLAGSERGKYKVFLDRHYRCHPGIIGFCNEAVYAPVGTPMEICTEGYDSDVTVPIRILGFQGDYCQRAMYTDAQKTQKTEDARSAGWLRQAELLRREEEKLPPASFPVNEDGRPRKSKRNARQVELFMALEWPNLKARLEQDPSLTVCILSPFRGQLAMLEETINAAAREGPIQVEWRSIEAGKADAGGDPARSKRGERSRDEGDVQPSRNDILVLTALKGGTVHKSQGQEFDIVYFLPVEDGQWEWPFSQKKRMINVAVSRARKELRVILSRGCVDEPSPPRNKGAGQDEGQMYLRKLVGYVDENATAEDREKGFGLRLSPLPSVFDDKPVDRTGESSGPEKRINALLDQIVPDLKLPWAEEKDRQVKRSGDLYNGLYHEVLAGGLIRDLGREPRELLAALKDQTGENIREDDLEAFAEYLETARFDFVLRDETGRPFLIIEVDGEIHRFPWYDRKKSFQDSYQDWLTKVWTRDRLKDKVVELLGGDVYHGNRCMDQWKKRADTHGAFALLRLPDDGSTWLETDKLRAEAGRKGPECDPVPEDEIQNCFTLEDLIRRYRPAPAEEYSSLTALLQSWTEEERETLKRCFKVPKATAQTLIQKIQPELREMGYLEHGENGWFPTGKGQALGIVRLRATKDGKDYPGYTPAVGQKVKELLLGEEET